MEFPASHYGTAAEVKRRARKMVAAVRAGASWADAVGAERLDTNDVEGAIVLENDGGELKTRPTIFIALPLEVVKQELAVLLFREAPPSGHPVLHELLETAWGTMALLGMFNVTAFQHVPTLMKPAVRAAVRWWPTWDGVGARYSWKGEPPRRLWDMPAFRVKMLLGALGMSPERLMLPLPPGGLAELVADEKLALD